MRAAARVVPADALDAYPYDLLPLAFRAVAAAGSDDPRLGRLKGVYRRTWYSNQLLLRRAGAALQALRSHGVEGVVLGGAALGVLHFRDAGVRAMDDTVIAVRGASPERARALLAGTVWPARSLAHADDELWAARVPIEVAQVGAAAACAGDQLLRTCANGIRASTGSRWAADALAILTSSGDAVDWHRLEAQAVAGRAAPHLHATLSYLRCELSAAVPAHVVASLGEAATPLGRGRLRLGRVRATIRASLSRR